MKLPLTVSATEVKLGNKNSQINNYVSFAEALTLVEANKLKDLFERRYILIVLQEYVPKDSNTVVQLSLDVSSSTGGRGQLKNFKTHVVFNKKTYKVRIDKEQNKYIYVQKSNVKLQDIRGKYRYVRT